MKQVTKGQWNGYDTYILHSRELEVTLLPWLGNNVISIWDNIQNRQVLRTPDENDLAFYMQKPYHFGMPMLIPPGRIRGGTSNMKAASINSTATRPGTTISMVCTARNLGESAISKKTKKAAR